MSRTGSRGVSLLEMLVALAIFGIVAAVLYGTFSRTLASRDYAVERADVFARARLALDWLERDLKGSLSVGVYPAGKPRFLSSGSDTTETFDLPLLDLTVRTVRRSAAPAGMPEESPGAVLVDQARVIYRVEDLGADDESAAARATAEAPALRGLVRYELRPPLEDRDDLDAALRTVLVRGVERLDLRFVDRGAEMDRWEPEEATSLRSLGPRTVDVRLVLTDDDGRATEITTAILVPLGGRGG